MENSKVVRNPKGRGKGAKNISTLKWDITVYDKETNTMRSGKFCTINQANEVLGTKLTTDNVWRLMTHNRVDESKRNKENSFLSRYGNISIRKINEPNPNHQPTIKLS